MRMATKELSNLCQVGLINDRFVIDVSQAPDQIPEPVVLRWETFEDLIRAARRRDVRGPSDENLLADFVSMVRHFFRLASGEAVGPPAPTDGRNLQALNNA